MAFVIYFGIGAAASAPFFQEGGKRLDSLWQIYMTPMFDQEPVFPLAFCATTSLLMSLLYFSKWFSEFSSKPIVGRICAALSVALLVLAFANFSRNVVIVFLMAALFTFLSWWRSDPEDNWR